MFTPQDRLWSGRRPLPEDREGLTRRVKACNMKFFITVNFYPETCTPAEIFCEIAKQGSTVSGFVDALTTTISYALQFGIPWQTLEKIYLHHAFEPRDEENSSIPHAMAVAVSSLIERRKSIYGEAEKDHELVSRPKVGE